MKFKFSMESVSGKRERNGGVCVGGRGILVDKVRKYKSIIENNARYFFSSP